MGAGYSTKRGVINLELGPEGPPPSFAEAQLDEHIAGVVLGHQHSLKTGRELFGEKADTAITKELQQIHDLETYDTVYKSDLSHKEKKDALESLMFITEKTNGTVKSRTVADGSKQRTYNGYEKSYGSSPTRLSSLSGKGLTCRPDHRFLGRGSAEALS